MSRMARIAALIVACTIGFIVNAWIGNVAAADITFPPLTGRVVDPSHLLPTQVAGALDQRLASHEQSSGQQIVVAIVPTLMGQAIEDYGYQLGRAWGIGQKDKNTGAILLVAPAERKVRIEVGYGLEGTLTDAVSRTIIERSILPSFRDGNIAEGVVGGTQAILAALGDTSQAVPAQRQPQRQAQSSGSALGLVFFFVILFFVLRARRGVLFPLMMGSTILGGGGYRGGGFGGGGFGGGGFGGGGGFSGGGGSFGGGGASGSW